MWSKAQWVRKLSLLEGSSQSAFETDERFSQYGKLAPKTKADYDFVQHMIYHLADN